MVPPRAEAFRRALLVAAGRSGRSGRLGSAERLRLCWRSGMSWKEAVAGCPEGVRLLWRCQVALGRRLPGLAEEEVFDAVMLTWAGIAWLGPKFGGVSRSGPAALPQPPERLAGAWGTLARGEAALAVPPDLSWHGRLCALEALRQRWPWLPRPREIVRRGPLRAAWQTPEGPGMCWDPEAPALSAWDPAAYCLR